MGMKDKLEQISAQQLRQKEAAISGPVLYSPTKNTTAKTVMGGLLDQTAYDTRAADRIAQDALRTGPSAWRGMMDTQLGQRYSAMGDQLAGQQAGQLAQARSSLASRGGLRGGSAERLAGQGMQAGLMERQRMARQKSQEMTGFDVQDELNRQQQLGQLGAMDAQKAAFQGQQSQFNLSNALNTLGNKSSFSMERYKQQMGDLGAARTAHSTRYGG
jgi:hypothetical protein